jgi:hypothetical protein
VFELSKCLATLSRLVDGQGAASLVVLEGEPFGVLHTPHLRQLVLSAVATIGMSALGMRRAKINNETYLKKLLCMLAIYFSSKGLSVKIASNNTNNNKL